MAAGNPAGQAQGLGGRLAVGGGMAGTMCLIQIAELRQLCGERCVLGADVCRHPIPPADDDHDGSGAGHSGERLMNLGPGTKDAGCGTPQHGLSSNKMALITSDCGAMRFPSIKWP